MTFQGLALLMLDAMVGEYDVEMKLGTITIEPLGPDRGVRAMPLDRLAGVFDASFHGTRN